MNPYRTKLALLLKEVELEDATEAGLLPTGRQIRPGESLTLEGFERGPTELVWLARVTRHDIDGREVLIPATAAVKLGLVKQDVLDGLNARLTPSLIQEEAERLERQAGLNRLRHYDEVKENIRRWMLAYPVVGLPMGLMEEVWPGAIGELADQTIGALCAAPLTSLPAWAVGACEGKKEPQWIKPALVTGGLILAVGLAVGVAVRVAGPRRVAVRATVRDDDDAGGTT